VGDVGGKPLGIVSDIAALALDNRAATVVSALTRRSDVLSTPLHLL